MDRDVAGAARALMNFRDTVWVVRVSADTRELLIFFAGAVQRDARDDEVTVYWKMAHDTAKLLRQRRRLGI